MPDCFIYKRALNLAEVFAAIIGLAILAGMTTIAKVLCCTGPRFLIIWKIIPLLPVQSLARDLLRCRPWGVRNITRDGDRCHSFDKPTNAKV